MVAAEYGTLQWIVEDLKAQPYNWLVSALVKEGRGMAFKLNPDEPDSMLRGVFGVIKKPYGLKVDNQVLKNMRDKDEFFNQLCIDLYTGLENAVREGKL